MKTTRSLLIVATLALVAAPVRTWYMQSHDRALLLIPLRP